MATSVTINGAVARQGPGNEVVIVFDVTVGGTHHQVPFLKSDLIKQGSVSNMRSYVARQCLATDAQATALTTVPTTDIDVRGTVSV